MTTEKRAKASEATVKDSKRQRTEKAKELIEQMSEKLASATEAARGIELKILKETTLLNKKYWPELKEVYLKRDALIAAEKNLWGHILCSHPQIEEEYYISPVEVPFVCNYLEKVELEDYIDDNGSYEITFTFGEGASEYFEPLKWTKRVILKDDCETIDEAKTTCTKMTFKNKEMDPLSSVAEMRKSLSEGLGEGGDMIDEMPVYSMSTWFSEVKPSLAGEFGEVFRKVVYLNPEIAIASALKADELSDDSCTSDDEADEK